MDLIGSQIRLSSCSKSGLYKHKFGFTLAPSCPDYYGKSNTNRWSCTFVSAKLPAGVAARFQCADGWSLGLISCQDVIILQPQIVSEIVCKDLWPSQLIYYYKDGLKKNQKTLLEMCVWWQYRSIHKQQANLLQAVFSHCPNTWNAGMLMIWLFTCLK